MGPNEAWSKRVRRIHNFYMMIYPTVVFIVLGLCGVGIGSIAITGFNPKWALDAASFVNHLFLPMVAAQIVSARLVFHRCPLTILESYLRGDEDMKKYWVVRCLRPSWAVTLLIAIPLVLYAIFTTFFFLLW